MSLQNGKSDRSYTGTYCRVGRIREAETGVNSELVEVWKFAENDRGRYSEEVLG